MHHRMETLNNLEGTSACVPAIQGPAAIQRLQVGTCLWTSMKRNYVMAAETQGNSKYQEKLGINGLVPLEAT